jgi:hypothetical protein
MYFNVGLVGILRPLHSPSYLGSQDRLFVISAFWRIGFLAYRLFGISAFCISAFLHIGLSHIGFLQHRLIAYRLFTKVTRSAFCHIGFLFLLARFFVILAFCILAFLHIGLLFKISSFLSYRLFVISAFCFIGFLTVGLFRSAFDLESSRDDLNPSSSTK